MSAELAYAVFRTPAGWAGVLGSRRGLRRLILPRPSPEEAARRLGAEGAVSSPGRFEDLIGRLDAYFAGRPAAFPDALDIAATPFRLKVWEAARLIPYGQTRSYGWVAGQIGRPGAARAVGQALGRNPLPVIIPCHRVLGAGGLGGFSEGLETKKFLLGLEAAR